MITFIELDNSQPYKYFAKKYKKALDSGQKNIEAICISSYDKITNQIDSRFVNLKYITKNEWIFFTNYQSPKSKQFHSHDQISAVFYWSEIETQIRIKAKIFKTDDYLSDLHYEKRDKIKNQVASFSNQSTKVNSYERFCSDLEKKILKNKFDKRPKNWGGFSFVPYYFEFWEGHDKRVNRREVYNFNNSIWDKYYLQP